MTKEPSADPAAKKLWDMVDAIKVAMMTTLTDGVMRSRPAACVQMDRRAELWFFTLAPADKAGSGAQRVNLGFVDTANEDYVSLSGTATIVRDRELVRKLWTEDQTVWFPKGCDDPDLALLRVDVEEAEYWDRPSRAQVGAFGLVKAIVDETPDLAENRKLTFAGAR